ncbi:MAG: helix-hairpin-helix domain-containing protein [Candidatus Sulfotelmatobacter sp.]
MQLLNRHSLTLIALALLFAGITACSNKDNPDEIRQRTAEATQTMRRDTKAVVEGVKEGMGRDKTVNINKASREDLLSLPGITEHDADRIIADRPFADTHELVTRHAISDTEYDKIRGQVIADR